MLTRATYSMISGAPINAFDFMSQAQIADVQARTSATNPAAALDVTAAIQAAIDSVSGPCDVVLPAGDFQVSSTIFLRRNNVRIVGLGFGVTVVRYVNSAGGIVFSGDTATYNSLHTYAFCSLENFSVERSYSNPTLAAANDPQIIVDLTSFSYSYFNIVAQSIRPGARIYYGQGNAGTSPYYNRIESQGLFGGADQSQTAIEFEKGAWTGGSDGPNANMIGPITRAASVGKVINLKSGQGNMFVNIGAESVGDTFIALGSNAVVDNGTSTGSNTDSTLNDTSKTWTTNQFVNGAVQITSGLGSGQVRHISSNSGTQLTLEQPWATIPDATSQYNLYMPKCQGNKFVNIRQEGSPSSNFIFAWPDSRDTEITQTSIQSAANYIDDRSCSPGNKFYGQSRTIIHHEFVTPGPNADINAFVKSSVFGGVRLAGQYAIDYVYASTTSNTHGDYATVTVDCGGTTVGGGSPSFALSVENGNSAGCAMPFGIRPTRSGENYGIFLNLKTGASFSAGVSVTVSIAVTMPGA